MKKKNIFISALIVVVLIVIALFVFSNKKVELITKVERNYDQETVHFVRDRIAGYEEQLAFFNEETSFIDKVNIYFVLSADHRMLGEYGIAKDYLDKARELDPGNTNLMQTYSSLLALMGDKKGALKLIDEAIEIYPVESNYWLWKIDLEKDLGISEKGLERVYQDALVQISEELNIVVSYASFLRDVDKIEDSIIQWEKAIELYPENRITYQQEIDNLKNTL